MIEHKKNMNNKYTISLLILFFALLLSGCLRSTPTSPVVPTNTPTAPTPRPSPTTTSVPMPTITPIPPTATKTLVPTYTATNTRTPTLTSTPGPDLALIYLNDGTLYRYDLSNWSEKPLDLPANGQITGAALGLDSSRLAYAIPDGIKVVDQPYQSVSVELPVSGEARNLVLSPDGSQLMYSNDEGLWISSLQDGTSELYYSNILDDKDVSKEIRHYPFGWFSDNQWIGVDIWHFEWRARVLRSIETGVQHEFEGCYEDFQWIPGKQASLVFVNFEEISGCGEESGLYLISVGEEQVLETRLYPETPPSVPWENSFQSLTWNPSHNRLAFIQDIQSEISASKLLLIDPDGKNVEEMATSEGKLATPLWSIAGDLIYYIDRRSTTNTIYRVNVNSHEQKALFSLEKEEELISISPDGQWLVVNQQQNTYLVSTVDGTSILVKKKDEYVQFVGWLR